MFGGVTQKDLSELSDGILLKVGQEIANSLAPITRDIDSLFSRIPPPTVQVAGESVTLEQIVGQVFSRITPLVAEAVKEALADYDFADLTGEIEVDLLTRSIAEKLVPLLKSEIDMSEIAKEVGSLFYDNDLVLEELNPLVARELVPLISSEVDKSEIAKEVASLVYDDIDLEEVTAGVIEELAGKVELRNKEETP